MLPSLEDQLKAANATISLLNKDVQILVKGIHFVEGHPGNTDWIPAEWVVTRDAELVLEKLRAELLRLKDCQE